jgi:hypothetical protein
MENAIFAGKGVTAAIRHNAAKGLKIVTWNKTNAQILQLMEDIRIGVKGDLKAYDEFIAVGAFEVETPYPSFQAMYDEFLSIHMNGYNIG